MSRTAEDIRQELARAEGELRDAESAARRERFDAAAQGRAPDPEVMAAPGKIGATLRELPDELYGAEVRAAQAKRDLYAGKLAEAREADPRLRAAFEAAAERLRAAEAEHERARGEYDQNIHRATFAQMQLDSAEKRLSELYERGPAAVSG